MRIRVRREDTNRARGCVPGIVLCAPPQAFEAALDTRTLAHLPPGPGAREDGAVAVHLFEAGELVEHPEGGYASPPVEASMPARSVVASWNTGATRPVEVFARFRPRGGTPGPWMRIGYRGDGPLPPPGPFPPGTTLEGDELTVKDSPLPPVELRVVAAQRPRRLGLAFWPVFDRIALPEGRSGTGNRPSRIAQYAVCATLGGRICGPSSLTMGLRALGIEADPAQVAAGAYDPWGDIYGNWSYLADEASRRGAAAWVERGGGPIRLAEHLARGRYAIVSLRWGPGELAGAPSAQTQGHLVLAVGATPEHLEVLDPAFRDPGVGVTAYPWQDVVRCWKSGAMVVLAREPGPA